MDAAVLSKALKKGSRPSKDSFPELPKLLQQFRLLAGIAVGLLCGLTAATGWTGFTLYGLVAVVATYVYYNVFLEADLDSFGGPQTLLMEGLQNGLAIMMLVWTIFYQFTGAKA